MKKTAGKCLSVLLSAAMLLTVLGSLVTVATVSAANTSVDMMPTDAASVSIVNVGTQSDPESTIEMKDGVLALNSVNMLRVEFTSPHAYDMGALNLLNMKIDTDIAFKIAIKALGSDNTVAWPNTSDAPAMTAVFPKATDVEDRVQPGNYDVDVDIQSACGSIVDKSAVTYDKFIIVLSGTGTFKLKGLTAFQKSMVIETGDPATPEHPWYDHAADSVPSVETKVDVLAAMGKSDNYVVNGYQVYGAYNDASQYLASGIDLNATPYLYYSISQPATATLNFGIYGSAPWYLHRDTKAYPNTPGLSTATTFDATTDVIGTETGCIDMRTYVADETVRSNYQLRQISFYRGSGNTVLNYLFFGSEATLSPTTTSTTTTTPANPPATPDHPWYKHAATAAPTVAKKVDILSAIGLTDNHTVNGWEQHGEWNNAANYVLTGINLNETPYLYYSISQPDDKNVNFGMYLTSPWYMHRDTLTYPDSAGMSKPTAFDKTCDIYGSETGCIDMRTYVDAGTDLTNYQLREIEFYRGSASTVLNYMFFGSAPGAATTSTTTTTTPAGNVMTLLPGSADDFTSQDGGGGTAKAEAITGGGYVFTPVGGGWPAAKCTYDRPISCKEDGSLVYAFQVNGNGRVMLACSAKGADDTADSSFIELNPYIAAQNQVSLEAGSGDLPAGNYSGRLQLADLTIPDSAKNNGMVTVTGIKVFCVQDALTMTQLYLEDDSTPTPSSAPSRTSTAPTTTTTLPPDVIYTIQTVQYVSTSDIIPANTEFTVEVYSPAVQSANMMELHLQFDNTVLACTAAETAGYVAQMEKNAAQIAPRGLDDQIWVTGMSLEGKNGAANEVIARLTFKVLKDITNGTEVTGLFAQSSLFVNGQNQFKTGAFAGAGGIVVAQPQHQLGDVDRNGVVGDMRDARLLFQYVSGTAKLDAEQLKLADVTGRGLADMLDARKLFQVAAGTASL